MDTDSFKVHLNHLSEDAEKRFGKLTYEVERLLLIDKDKKLSSLINDELDWKIMRKFVGLRPKTNSYFTHDVNGDKKVKGTK